jgi:hypothetical protein
MVGRVQRRPSGHRAAVRRRKGGVGGGGGGRAGDMGAGARGLDAHLLRHAHLLLRHAVALLRHAHLLLRHAVALLLHAHLLLRHAVALLLRLVVVEHAHDVILLVDGRGGLGAVEGGAEARRVAKVAEAALALRLLRCRCLEAAEWVLGCGRRRARHGLVEGEEVGTARRLRHGRRHGHACGGGRRRGAGGRG